MSLNDLGHCVSGSAPNSVTQKVQYHYMHITHIYTMSSPKLPIYQYIRYVSVQKLLVNTHIHLCRKLIYINGAGTTGGYNNLEQKITVYIKQRRAQVNKKNNYKVSEMEDTGIFLHDPVQEGANFN